VPHQNIRSRDACRSGTQSMQFAQAARLRGDRLSSAREAQEAAEAIAIALRSEDGAEVLSGV
jgi:hypothetical protein